MKNLIIFLFFILFLTTGCVSEYIRENYVEGDSDIWLYYNDKCEELRPDFLDNRVDVHRFINEVDEHPGYIRCCWNYLKENQKGFLDEKQYCFVTQGLEIVED